MNCGLSKTQFTGLPKFCESFRKTSGVGINLAPKFVSNSIVWVLLNYFLHLLGGPVVMAGPKRNNCDRRVVNLIERVERLSLLEFSHSFIKAPHQTQVPTVMVMPCRFSGTKFDGPLIFSFSASLIPVVSHFDFTQCCMRVSERIIDFERSLCG